MFTLLPIVLVYNTDKQNNDDHCCNNKDNDKPRNKTINYLHLWMACTCVTWYSWSLNLKFHCRRFTLLLTQISCWYTNTVSSCSYHLSVWRVEQRYRCNDSACINKCKVVICNGGAVAVVFWWAPFKGNHCTCRWFWIVCSNCANFLRKSLWFVWINCSGIKLIFS